MKEEPIHPRKVAGTKILTFNEKLESKENENLRTTKNNNAPQHPSDNEIIPQMKPKIAKKKHTKIDILGQKCFSVPRTNPQ